MPNATVSPPAPSKKIVCPRYEVIFEYVRLTERPLTGLEQRAFLDMRVPKIVQAHAKR